MHANLYKGIDKLFNVWYNVFNLRERRADMEKSVYSIVLSDDVVEAVDAMAYAMNTSRSNLINQILAEHLSLLTPEMRMREIFAVIRDMMEPKYLFPAQPSEAMLSIKSPVKYKYKPTLRYTLELSRDFGGKVGRLKVAFRTKSEQLISAANGFFALWQRLENKYLTNVYPEGAPALTENGRYTRDFYSPKVRELSDEEIARAVGEYIRALDSSVQTYFDGLTEGRERSREIEAQYKAYLGKVKSVI